MNNNFNSKNNSDKSFNNDDNNNSINNNNNNKIIKMIIIIIMIIIIVTIIRTFLPHGSFTKRNLKFSVIISWTYFSLWSVLKEFFQVVRACIIDIYKNCNI